MSPLGRLGGLLIMVSLLATAAAQPPDEASPAVGEAETPQAVGEAEIGQTVGDAETREAVGDAEAVGEARQAVGDTEAAGETRQAIGDAEAVLDGERAGAALDGERLETARPIDDRIDAVAESAADPAAQPTAGDEAPGSPGAPIDDGAEAEARGLAYLYGRGVPADAVAAARWLERASAADRPVAHAALAELLLAGNGVAQDLDRGFALYLRAAERGVPEGQRYVGWAYLAGQAPGGRDPAAAHRWLSAASHQGDTIALYNLAHMYRYGDGVGQDVDLANDLVMRAAELGFAPAQRDAGIAALYSGPAESRDPTMGLYLLEKAAAVGEPSALYFLGTEYLYGTHVERSYSAAADWLSRAADAHPLAKLWLSELLAKGLGVPKDSARAAELRATALEAASPGDKNTFAWQLSVISDDALRNGELAVEIMQRVLESPEHRVPALIDTLAAAYAEAGRLDDAVAAQLDALDALPPGVPDDASAPMRDRLELYRAGKAYRE